MAATRPTCAPTVPAPLTPVVRCRLGDRGDVRMRRRQGGRRRRRRGHQRVGRRRRRSGRRRWRLGPRHRRPGVRGVRPRDAARRRRTGRRQRRGLRRDQRHRPAHARWICCCSSTPRTRWPHRAPGRLMSKYQLVRQALLRFARDPASAGLGMGVQFFPLPGPGSSCQSDLDCGFVDLAHHSALRAGHRLRRFGGRRPDRASAAAAAAGRPASRSAAAPRACSTAPTSVRPARAAWPATPAAGFGKSLRRRHRHRRLLRRTLYEQPFVPIATLPSPGRAAGQLGPGRALPVGRHAAAAGGGGRARPASAATSARTPGRKGVMVLASDGAPSPGCANNTVAATAAAAVRGAHARRHAAPSTPTSSASTPRPTPTSAWRWRRWPPPAAPACRWSSARPRT